MLTIINENQLDNWVRGNAAMAQRVVVETVWRLVAASVPHPKDRRFPLGDSIGQHGPDGFLDTELPREPYVPEGVSYWEIGSGLNAARKATDDYRELTAALPESVRLGSTFVFVTPLSGRREWEHTWKEDAQGRWLDTRRAGGEWKDVRIIDGTRLIDWLHQFPAVELWLSCQVLGSSGPLRIDSVAEHWELIRSIGEPPPLAPQVFTTNRDAACQALGQILNGTSDRLRLDTLHPDQVVDFIAAYVAGLDPENRADATGRCLVIGTPDAWLAVADLPDRHVLVADVGLDLGGHGGTKLIQAARKKGHAVVYGASPGGIPDSTRVLLLSPKPYQLQEALEKSGYKEERARTLAQRSGGNLKSLLRCLQNLSEMPEWAEGSAAAELAIAVALGSWSEDSEADRELIETVSGKAYGEWIGAIRDAALRPGTPLVHRDGVWSFVLRYEGWYALGACLFDEHLERLRTAIPAVLAEPDPQFDLPPDQRYAASVFGKTRTHSAALRAGLAGTLALLGGHPGALRSCSCGKAETVARVVVRGLLDNADWRQWATLGENLPLLAEAAPVEFLDGVDKALSAIPCPFDALFDQEESGITGRNYMTGVLWAIETLAWGAEYLGASALCLGRLAARDPGGNWGNRPINSLKNIFSPWYPQTAAPLTKRVSSVAALLKEARETGWILLLDFLPTGHHTAWPTRRPQWRELIPDDWADEVAVVDYHKETLLYCDMAIEAAKGDCDRLTRLVSRLDDLPPDAFTELVEYLESTAAASLLTDGCRERVWMAVADLVTQHRRFSDAQWAMSSSRLRRLEELAERVRPDESSARHRRLFTDRDFDLLDDRGSYEEQVERLRDLRSQAITEIAAGGGVDAVLDFAQNVESPWRAGIAAGDVLGLEADSAILPRLLIPEDAPLAKFTAGFVWARCRSRGWDWVDAQDTEGWNSAQMAQFLALLPFCPDSWDRAATLLREEGEYWIRTSANPYDCEAVMDRAVDRLVEYGRPWAAVRCLHRTLLLKHTLDAERATRTLLAAVASSEDARSMETHGAIEVIKALQADTNTDPGELLRVEWAYLPILNEHHHAAPLLSWRRLASEPRFFCEVIRLVFRARNEDTRAEPTEEARVIAHNAYRLLSEWRRPPGLLDDGTFSGRTLAEWLSSVRAECQETGHLEIAMEMTGRVLVHVPPDADGLWIDRAAADVLNTADNRDVLRGFVTELYNSRGVHVVDRTGQADRNLAAKYREKADAADNAGYPRLALSLRQLADSYDREAEENARDDDL